MGGESGQDGEGVIVLDFRSTFRLLRESVILYNYRCRETTKTLKPPFQKVNISRCLPLRLTRVDSR